MTKYSDKVTDELSDMPFMEKKYSTKDVDKGTYEVADMKQAVVTIIRKGLYQFEGHSKTSKRLFKLDSAFLKTTFSTSHSEFYNFIYIEDQDTELYTTFIVPFDE